MICSRCGTINDDNNTFCSYCGARLVITEPITAAVPSMQENAKAKMCLDVMKKRFGSKLFLSAIIVCGVIFLFGILLSLPSFLPLIGLGVSAGGIIGIAVSLMAGLLPSILMFVAYVKIYNTAHKGESLPLNTSGHKLIRGLLTFCNVMYYISLALLAVIYVILLLIPLEELAWELSSMYHPLSGILLKIFISFIMIFAYAMLILYIIYFRKLKGDYKNLEKCFESGVPFKGLSLYVTVFDIISAASILFTAPSYLIIAITSSIIAQETAITLLSLILVAVATLPALYVIIVKIIIRFGVNKDLKAINSLN